MSSLTGLSPNNPLRYEGASVAVETIVTRNREPTGADYRQPETGKLYPFGCLWLVGKNPTTGNFGDLWYLSKIEANVGYWVYISSDNIPTADKDYLMLQSRINADPVWSQSTWPDTTTINQVLYSSANNTVAEIATANQAILNTDITGVPSMQSSPVVSGTMNAIQGYVGTTTGAQPSLGNLGYLNGVTVAPAVAIANNIPVGAAILQLPAGAFDLQGNILFNADAITGTLFEASISTSPSTRSAGSPTATITPTSPTVDSDMSLLTPVVRVYPTTTTNYYLTAFALYTVGSLTASFAFRAIRIG